MHSSPRMRFRLNNRTKSLIIFLGVLGLFRALLPYGIQWYANRVLDQNPDYDGYIGDVDVSLWRWAYQVENIQIVKTDGEIPVPLYEARQMDFAIAWRDLLKGAVVSESHAHSPRINFVDAKSDKEKQTGAGKPWGSTLEKLSAFRISHFVISDGSVHLRNFQSRPPVDLWMKNIEGRIENITNSQKISDSLFAKARASGTVLGGARFEFSLRLNPDAAKPTFDLDAKLSGLQLPELNAFFNEYASLDFEKGKGDIVAEIASSNGKLSGYVKPLFQQIDVLSAKDVSQKESLFKLAWQAVAGTIAEVFENQPKDQLATRIPVTGSAEDPKTDIIATIGSVLCNAFVQAFSPFYEDSVNLAE